MSARTPSAAAARSRGRRVLPVLAFTALALLAGLAGVGPAAAIDDSTRPDARVTHGPSCRPGGVVVEVVAGSAPYAVTLATTRTPDGEDFAEVEPGGTVVLRTGGVTWGETIDGWLEYRALDGSGDAWVDDLAGYTFTRPAEEDCAAITAPAAPATVPGTDPSPDAGPDPVAPEPAGDAPVSVPATVEPAAGPGPVRVIEPGAPAPEEEVRTVEAATAAPLPAAVGRESSVAPLFLAAVALGAAATGLGSALGVPGLRRRRPTPRA